MAERRFHLSPEREAESLVTAFYRFLEVRSRDLDGDENACGIKTIVEDRAHVKVVTLWNEQAASDFVRFWDDYRAAHIRPVAQWMAGAAGSL
jgi:hypothetical protein